MIDHMTTSLTAREHALLKQILTTDEISVLEVVIKHGNDGIVQMYIKDELPSIRSIEISKALLGLINKNFVVKEMTKVPTDSGKFIITNLVKLVPGIRERMMAISEAACKICSTRETDEK